VTAQQKKRTAKSSSTRKDRRDTAPASPPRRRHGRLSAPPADRLPLHPSPCRSQRGSPEVRQPRERRRQGHLRRGVELLWRGRRSSTTTTQPGSNAATAGSSDPLAGSVVPWLDLEERSVGARIDGAAPPDAQGLCGGATGGRARARGQPQEGAEGQRAGKELRGRQPRTRGRQLQRPRAKAAGARRAAAGLHVALPQRPRGGRVPAWASPGREECGLWRPATGGEGRARRRPALAD
jgi:hypothetical protein